MPRAQSYSQETSTFYKRRSSVNKDDMPYTSSAHSSTRTAQAQDSKRKHVCSTCDRAFTTGGHLARHSRIHSGERAHACPFPNCETRCSRQDNLQQHYRIHLSPGSRRTSTRGSAALTRTRMPKSRNVSAPVVTPAPAESSVQLHDNSHRHESYTSAASSHSSSLSPAPASPPAEYEQVDDQVVPSSMYPVPPPPNSPPALVQAVLPATASRRSSHSASSSRNVSQSPVLLHRMESRQVSEPPESAPIYPSQQYAGNAYQDSSRASYRDYVGSHTLITMGPGGHEFKTEYEEDVSRRNSYASPISSRSSSTSGSQHQQQYSYQPQPAYEQVVYPTSAGYESTSSPSDAGLPPSPIHVYPDTARIYSSSSQDHGRYAAHDELVYGDEYPPSYGGGASQDWYGSSSSSRSSRYPPAPLLSPVRDHRLPPMRDSYGSVMHQPQPTYAGYQRG